MQIDDAKIQEILLAGSYVTKEDMDKAQEFANTHHAPLVDYLFAEGLVTKDLLGQAIAESLGVPYADLNSNQPSREQTLRIPEELAKKFRIVLFRESEEGLTITTDDPANEGIPAILEKLSTHGEVTLAYSLPEDIDAVFLYYQKPLETRFSKIIREEKRVAPEILEEIFNDAFSYHASDIHFEPQPDDVLVRFRVDGMMREAGHIPKEHYENLLNHIKIRSRLRIDEHFAAQDGSLHYQKDGNVVDMRTSVVPTVEGEKAALRILTNYSQGFTLADLGLSEAHREAIERASQKPFGMLLVTGPTGSGKTTTLYVILKLLNNADVNITTIEDPVEYKVQGINQIQVNLQTNLTFASGLRSIVRQDPDIILVGEIRDAETAEIGVNAALTGHLLLSTFHANDAATAIPRLLDMGVEPFLLASTLELIVAQRLVRKICDQCRYSVVFSLADLSEKFKLAKQFFTDKRITLYQGKGCKACTDSGYSGRTAIFELILMSPQMKELILQRPSNQNIWKLTRQEGSTSLFEDGIEKVKSGATTLEELLRVAEPPDLSLRIK